MDIVEFVELAKRSTGGTFTVSNRSSEWEVSRVNAKQGFQVGVGNLAMIPLRRDGQDIADDYLWVEVVEAVSEFHYGNLQATAERQLGLWVENDSNGEATLYIDQTVWVADQLSANIVGAILGEKEIYDWANDKCLTVIPAGK